MGLRRIRSVPWTALLVTSIVVRPAANPPPVTDLLERYAAGDFSGVASTLDATTDFNELLKQLKRVAPAWLDAGGRPIARAANLRPRRSRSRPRGRASLTTGSSCSTGCASTTSTGTRRRSSSSGAARSFDRRPRPGRSSASGTSRRWPWLIEPNDFEFLIGSPWEGRANPKDEIEHLKHSAARFPHERRFALAQGIAVEWRLFPSRSRERAKRSKFSRA